MTKMTYGEQLKHPNWQRVRLEALNRAGWKCEACTDTETTLHVHHKRYIKGRMAWEYPADNFTVLCEPCHEEAHGQMDRLLAVVAGAGPKRMDSIAALLAGYLTGVIDDGLQAEASSHDTYSSNLGFLAAAVGREKVNVYEVCDLATALGDPQFRTELTAALKASFERLSAP